jgi:hypothetical protein
VAPRLIQIKEYTWAGVNDMQALFRKVKWGVKQSRDAFNP